MQATTYNSALTLATSSSPLVDFFFISGASRGKNINNLFEKAFFQDPDKACRILMWLRDCRGGAGERQLFRDLFKHLTNLDIDSARKVLLKVPEIGRWDDVLHCGDGNTTGDIRVTAAGGDVFVSSNDSPEVVLDPINDHLELRAERAGSGGGRTYTIEITATDASGNQTASTVKVNVPHDQGN